MKKFVLFFLSLSAIAACNNKAKVASASTDSVVSNSAVSTRPAEPRKEVRYVNTETPAQPEKKKGWSSAAKGAVIGGAAGAVTGAVVDKKHRVQGAAIGTVVGAGAGYLVGRHKDKKKKRRH